MTTDMAPATFTPHPVATNVTQTTAVEQARAIAEVQSAVVVAQQCPRDITRAEGEMRDACGRQALATRAFYRVPNRGQGPSVHLARELARIWGNVQYGVHELRRDDRAGMSEVQAFAWDLQTNARSTRTFQVPHQRMKSGERVALTDLGDVYLNNQNIGARAVRECIYTILPAWFVDAAEEACRNTLVNGDGKPLSQRINDAVTAFAATYGVKAAQLEDNLGRKRGQWDAGDVASLTILFRSLQRGEVAADEEFGQQRVTGADFASTSTPVPPAPKPTTDPEPTPEPEPAPVDVSDAVELPEDLAPDPDPEAITNGQMRALHASFRDAGITERGVRLDYCRQVTGRDLQTAKDLTKEEAWQVIDALKADAQDKTWSEQP